METVSLTDRAYTPPRAVAAQRSPVEVNPARTAGALLLIDSALDLTQMALQFLVGWRPSPTTIVLQAVQIGVGGGLLRVGRTVAGLAVLFLALRMGMSLFLSAQLLARGQVATLLGVLLQVLMSATPPALLLIGRCGPTRRRVAIGLFVLEQGVRVLGGASQIVYFLGRAG